MKRRVFPSALAFALAVTTVPALAQVAAPMDTYVSSFLGDQLRYNQLLINERNRIGGGSSSHHTWTPHDQAEVDAATRWPRPNVTDATVNPITHFSRVGPSTIPATYAAQVKGSAQTRHEVAEFYRKLLADYDSLLTKNHETRRRNDLAGAYTFAAQAAYYVASGGVDLNDASQNALLAQVGTSLVNSNARSMTDAQKQNSYDTVVLLGELIMRMTQYAHDHSDQAMAQSYLDTSNQLLTTFFGAPAARLHFTAQGVTTI